MAELGGCILLHLLGESEAAGSGGAWAYIQRYAQAAEIEEEVAVLGYQPILVN